ncbi:hypothetical protein P7K49_003985 [Saguinus oedipus]|uniref:PDZ domain-containing protein n=1 Tax=Saguinus oedipus TaxID=9490 RepID=A0ABQ9W7P6_SAGOE|nr:hypothetical protein P7K49_003985 [Saguinus oedipus]
MVELERGPSGLGMGLIDGMVSGPGPCPTPMQAAWLHSLKPGCTLSGHMATRRPLGRRVGWPPAAGMEAPASPMATPPGPAVSCFCPQAFRVCPGPVGMVVSTAFLEGHVTTMSGPGWMPRGPVGAKGGTAGVLAGDSKCQRLAENPEASACPQHTRLGTPGLYIQTLLPGSPAAADGCLLLGDRILEVNGSSLLGLGYLRYPHHLHTPLLLPDTLLWGGDLGWQERPGCTPWGLPVAPLPSLTSGVDFRAVDLIRHGGKKMRFLVAKSDVETAKKIHFCTPPL